MPHTLEKTMLMELIGSARKNPEKARALFEDTVKDLRHAIEVKDHDMFETIVTIGMNMLPKEIAVAIKERNNLKMAAGLLEEFLAYVGKDLSVFTHAPPPACDCSACKAGDRKVHLAN